MMREFKYIEEETALSNAGSQFLKCTDTHPRRSRARLLALSDSKNKNTKKTRAAQYNALLRRKRDFIHTNCDDMRVNQFSLNGEVGSLPNRR